jgi:phosphoribosylglycinamide formyltransferase 1
MARKSVDILISGRGSNMEALVLAAMNPQFPATIKRVISNRADAGGLAIAKKHDISTVVLDQSEFESRQAHEEALLALVEKGKPDLICLAGYMRILGSGFVRRFSGRILNIHPSLLPAFRGMDAHERAIVEGVRLHGASVHFVTDGVDEGPVIAQAAVPVLPGDEAEALAARVLAVEHKLYPHALALVASGAVRWSGGNVVHANGGGGSPETEMPADNRQSGEEVLFSPPLAAR